MDGVDALPFIWHHFNNFLKTFASVMSLYALTEKHFTSHMTPHFKVCWWLPPLCRESFALLMKSRYLFTHTPFLPQPTHVGT